MNLKLTIASFLLCVAVLFDCKPSEDQREKDFQSRLFSLATSSSSQQNQNGNNDSFFVGGTVTGLGLSNNLILRNNNTDVLTININGVFKFAQTYKDGDSYSVTVLQQPVNKFCSIPNGVGSIARTDVLTILVNCN
ncbi:hypothetical protein EHQ12_11525 [Leptospira gomenensis]|uniref:Uncharacterized protein n=1 Tax=Leptospira gomenensis TaxID=2484974 RepID=A0A5F1YXW5_9LEPT|nr:hypothetical protein [Leptospira gomenensis]TGK34928.1 hypothetical protein EHQ17_07800 [Leptospira gomenensis]TGK36724.1 hypothetical protein EHQ12_11525 [Leptospira gomenensis]TGK48871.1 hypothetical protein EHQ07_05910 [Leptospira gomenensis]TGK64637.1 hypothetical protein EHQ13_07085 [Leptospira gomenensis]